MVLSYEDVATRLGFDESYSPWREPFPNSQALVDDAEALPYGGALRDRCRVLGFPDGAIEATLETRRVFDAEPAWGRLLAHARWMSRDEVPRTGSWLVPWMLLPEALDEAGRMFYALVFLSEVPRMRRWHAARGVSDEVSIATLADVGVNLAHYHRTFGRWGLDEPAWLGHHFAGQIFQLGRLQFQLGAWWVPPAEDAECPLAVGDPVLDVHIPATGPLDPDACDKSFEHAREFFAASFPEFEARQHMCLSWILDPQLAEYLPADSNLLRFQRRFEPVAMADRFDGQIVKFVFRRPPETAIGDLHPRTTLERAVVSHLEAGGQWSAGIGYF